MPPPPRRAWRRVVTEAQEWLWLDHERRVEEGSEQSLQQSLSRAATEEDKEWAMLDLAAYYRRQRQWGQAEAAYLRCQERTDRRLVLARHVDHIRGCLGLCYQAQGRGEEAWANLSAAVARKEQNNWVLLAAAAELAYQREALETAEHYARRAYHSYFKERTREGRGPDQTLLACTLPLGRIVRLAHGEERALAIHQLSFQVLQAAPRQGWDLPDSHFGRLAHELESMSCAQAQDLLARVRALREAAPVPSPSPDRFLPRSSPLTLQTPAAPPASVVKRLFRYGLMGAAGGTLVASCDYRRYFWLTWVGLVAALTVAAVKPIRARVREGRERALQADYERYQQQWQLPS